MTRSDREKCISWIDECIKPCRYVNHMHTSLGLWQMMASDTGVDITHTQFKKLMEACGYVPANPKVRDCEYRISSTGLRRRAVAEVNGWLPSHAGTKRTRLR